MNAVHLAAAAVGKFFISLDAQQALDDKIFMSVGTLEKIMVQDMADLAGILNMPSLQKPAAPSRRFGWRNPCLGGEWVFSAGAAVFV